jgi:hypothetical protein
MWEAVVAFLSLIVGYILGVMMRDKRYLDLEHDYQALRRWMWKNVAQDGRDAVLRGEARKVLGELES